MPTDNATFITPLGLGFTLIMGVLMLFVPRRLVLVPLILCACFMTLGERIIIASLDFTMMRILVVFGWARLVLKHEIPPLRLNEIDKAIIWWTVAAIITHTLLWQTSDAFINRLGLAYNALGIYFLCRFLIMDFDDINRLFKVLAIAIVPLALAMLIERATGRNLFAVFGGVKEFSEIRNGELRAQGSFAHPILAGTFGATLMPLFVSLWWQDGRNKMLSILGVLSATVITLTSSSGGPITAYFFGIVGFAFWVFRKRMRAVRWALVLAIFSLHVFIMKAPIWFLIGRLSSLVGGTGYHRAILIDRAIAHFSEWWLIGTKSVASWSEILWREDITNQYILEGVRGGLITMILFIVIIALCFRGLGRSLRLLEDEPLSTRITIWSMGVALLVHVVSFISVSYFDQLVVFWYLLLAMISTARSVTSTIVDSQTKAACA
jgi:hypothetical protein